MSATSRRRRCWPPGNSAFPLFELERRAAARGRSGRELSRAPGARHECSVLLTHRSIPRLSRRLRPAVRDVASSTVSGSARSSRISEQPCKPEGGAGSRTRVLRAGPTVSLRSTVPRPGAGRPFCRPRAGTEPGRGAFRRLSEAAGGWLRSARALTISLEAGTTTACFRRPLAPSVRSGQRQGFLASCLGRRCTTVAGWPGPEKPRLRPPLLDITYGGLHATNRPPQRSSLPGIALYCRELREAGRHWP